MEIRRSAVVVAFVVLTTALAAVALVLAGTTDPARLAAAATVIGLFVLPFAVTGSVVTAKRPENRIGPLFCAVALLQAINVSGRAYGEYGLPEPDQLLPAAAEVAWLADLTWFPSLGLLITFLPLLFPTGHPPTKRWSWVGWLSGAAIALSVLTWAAVTWPERGAVVLDEETTSELTGLGLLLPVGMVGVAVGALASLVSLAVRVRRSSGDERQQLWWFMWAITVSAAAIVTTFLVSAADAPPLVRDLLLGIAVITVPLATGIAILRYRLYEIDLLVNRTLVYGALTAVTLGIYVALVTLTGRLLDGLTDWQAALPATAVVALLLLPLRTRMQTAINRLMYGDRDDPYAVLARLGRHLESVRTPGDTLSGLVATVASALRLPYVAVHLDVDAQTPPVASWGTPAQRPTVFPLAYRGAQVGSLAVGSRGPGEQLAPRERQLLEALAAQAGVAVHAERLSLDLQRSRQRLVTTREEERRRLRRDLHDGLGPTLAGVALGVEAAGNHLVGDPDAAAALGTVRDQVKTALDDIRRLVDGLRPPALDELGLVDALRGHALSFEALAARDGEGVRITVLPSSEPLPKLPAAVETAAYRIALEAVTNVVRHAGARDCLVRVNCLETLDTLEVEITDDGRGMADQPSGGGVGMASMSERAAELGGSLTVQSRPGEGTDVLARLPVHS